MDAEIRNIVMGVAEVGGDDHFLSPAIELAGSLGATLHVVHAFRVPEPMLYAHAELLAIAPDAIEQLQATVQQQLEEWVRRQPGAERVRCRAVPGPAYGAVLDTAGEVHADLLLVGATRRGAIARALLGTSAQRILRGASVPVLMMRKPERLAPQRILLTTDLSEISEKVHEKSAGLLAALGATEATQIRSLMVLGYDLPFPPPVDRTVMKRVAEEQLGRFLDAGARRTLRVEGKVRLGEPAREIVAEADEWAADLLVLGTHGRKGASRFLIGSVAESVLRKSSCNVLVIPTVALGLGRFSEQDTRTARAPAAGTSTSASEGDV